MGTTGCSRDGVPFAIFVGVAIVYSFGEPIRTAPLDALANNKSSSSVFLVIIVIDRAGVFVSTDGSIGTWTASGGAHSVRLPVIFSDEYTHD
jgi:hypothetical protein